VSKQLTHFKGSDQIPSWYKDKIYYASDESLTLNIHSYDLKTGRSEQLTNHTEYDVMWPSGKNNLLVYENGGYLLKLDLATGKESKISVKIEYDSSSTLPYYKNVKDNIYGMSISPTGKRSDRTEQSDFRIGFRLSGNKEFGIQFTRYTGRSSVYEFTRSYNFIGGYFNHEF